MKYFLSAEDAKSLCRLFYDVAALEDLKADFLKRMENLQLTAAYEQEGNPEVKAFLSCLSDHLSLSYDFVLVLKYKYDFLG